jgi:hypothetical protein
MSDGASTRGLRDMLRLGWRVLRKRVPKRDGRRGGIRLGLGFWVATAGRGDQVDVIREIKDGLPATGQLEQEHPIRCFPIHHLPQQEPAS